METLEQCVKSFQYRSFPLPSWRYNTIIHHAKKIIMLLILQCRAKYLAKIEKIQAKLDKNRKF